jgi:hypothetical protein
MSYRVNFFGALDPSMLVFLAPLIFLIISHPGVEKLYAAVIARGAAQWAADAREGKGGG